MSRKKYSSILIVAMLIFALAASMAYAYNKKQGQTGSSFYLENEQGQSYGVLPDTALAGQEPDLIAAQTSNGENGYITKEDYTNTTTPAASREEAASIMEEYEQGAWEAFCACVRLNTGSEVSPESRVVLIDVMFRGRIEYPWFMLTEEEQSAVISILPEEYRSAELAEKAWEAGIGANDYCIPVYAEDGETIIGEMWIR